MIHRNSWASAFLRTVVVLAVFFAGFAHAQVADINSAINKAGRQRMLAHRMAKAYFQLGLGVDGEKSKNVLDTSMSLFDRQLVELKNYAPTGEIRDIYKQLETAWIEYKDVLIGAAPNKENGKKVLASSELIYQIADKGTVALEKQAGTAGGHLVNSAGRARMMSQRMAKLYQAQAWKIGGNETDALLDQTRKEFVATVSDLSINTSNTQQIKNELDLVKQQWAFFDLALGQRSGAADPKQMANVATTSERILAEMETVVGLYEKITVR